MMTPSGSSDRLKQGPCGGSKLLEGRSQRVILSMAPFCIPVYS